MYESIMSLFHYLAGRAAWADGEKAEKELKHEEKRP